MSRLARHLNRTAVLIVTGLGCLDAAAWHTFGTGAGLAAVGASLLVVEYLTGDEQEARR